MNIFSPNTSWKVITKEIPWETDIEIFVSDLMKKKPSKFPSLISRLEKDLSKRKSEKHAELISELYFEKKFTISPSFNITPNKSIDGTLAALYRDLTNRIMKSYSKGLKLTFTEYRNDISRILNYSLTKLHHEAQENSISKEKEEFELFTYGSSYTRIKEELLNDLYYCIYKGIHFQDYRSYIEKRYNEINHINSHLVEQNINVQPTSAKLIWNGKPAHLAFIIDLLIEKGYLEATEYGERTAEILLKFINFEKYKPSKESLGRLLHKGTDNAGFKGEDLKNKFLKIPYLKDL